MNKLIIEYDPDNGLAFTDSKAKEYLEYVINNKIPQIKVGNELFITLARCAVAEKKIRHNEAEFLFKGSTIKIDKCGGCKEWPKGFGDFDINATETLLTIQHNNAVKKAKHSGTKKRLDILNF